MDVVRKNTTPRLLFPQVWFKIHSLLFLFFSVGLRNAHYINYRQITMNVIDAVKTFKRKLSLSKENELVCDNETHLFVIS